jgi:hypothetical protein
MKKGGRIMAGSAVAERALFPFDVSLPAKQESSLSSKAMLCTLSISAWSGYCYDRQASYQIAQIHHADKDSGRFNKRLVPRAELEEITKLVGRARRDHEFITLPWSDNGLRVLPAATYMEHVASMKQHASEFNAAVARLLERFEELVRNQSRLGTLFKVADYPGMREEGGILRFSSPQELLEKFSFATKVQPMPDADDFRVSLGDEDRERIKRQIADSIQASLRVATRELWQRLYKVVSHMSERMIEYNTAPEGEKPKLYDSMITNIVEIVDVLPKLNIAGDTELDRMGADVRSSLIVNPKTLRSSQLVRSETAKAAVEIAQKMAAYMGMAGTAAG